MYALPPANTVAGELLRRMPSTLETSDARVIANFTVASDDTQWVTIVSTVILTLTIIGASAILGTMAYLEYKGRPGTTRQRIVQSLVLSDLILGIVGLIGSAMELSGHPLTPGTSSCDGLGFMLITVLWTEHLWTLSLAVATFLILIYPLHSVTMILERHWYILWLFVWAIAIAMATVGLEVFGMFPSSGICYYGQNAGLYAELVQFIPRGLVFLVISVLYWRLFVFLRRPDRIRGSFSDSTQNTSRRGRLSNVLARRSGGRLTGLFGRIVGAPQPKTASQDEAFRAEKVVRVETRGSRGPDAAGVERPNAPARIDLPHAGRPLGWPQAGQGAPGRDGEKLGLEAIARDQGQLSPGSLAPMSPRTLGTPGLVTPTPTPVEIPPWERVQLPVFEVDGQKFGGSAANSVPRDGLWSNWKGLGATKDGKRRPGTGGSSTGPAGAMRHSPAIHRPSTATSDGAGSAPRSPPVQPYGRDNSDASSTLPDQMQFFDAHAGGRPRWSSVQTDQTNESSEKDRLRKISATSAGSTTPSTSSAQLLSIPRATELRRPPSPAYEVPVYSRRSSATQKGPKSPLANQADATTGTTSPAETYRPDGMFSPSDRGSGSSTPRRRQSEMDADLEMGPMRLPNPNDEPRRDEDDDDDEDEDGDGRLDFLRFLTEDRPAGTMDAGGVSRGRYDGSASNPNGEEYEFVEESMSSYLNRKTALLMLWFPLGYVMLFSVSLIRIIYDFVGQPPTELRAISRWFIFAQGILDALIYGIVEWHTKRVVRKRVRKGTFSPHGSHSARNASQIGSGLGIASALRGFRSSTSRPPPNGPTSSRGALRSLTGGFGAGSQLSYGQTASRGRLPDRFIEEEEDPKSLMQALDTMGPTSSASGSGSGSGSHGLRIGGLPPGIPGENDEGQRRGSEAISVGSQLTNASTMTSTGGTSTTKVSDRSGRKTDEHDGVKRIDYADGKDGER